MDAGTPDRVRGRQRRRGDTGIRDSLRVAVSLHPRILFRGGGDNLGY
jgi:hypothetical protein